MRSESQPLQQAIEDLATIRRAIDAVESNNPKPATGPYREANLLIHGAILAAAGGFTLVEILGRGQVSEFLMATRSDQELKVWSIGYMFGFVLLLLVTAYFIVVRASQKSGETVSIFLAQNFVYLRNLSLVSDLLVKVSLLTLLVSLNKPEFLGPALFLFTGDFLIQGRVFSLPLRASLFAGLVCFVAGIAQYWTHSSLLLWPLLVFTALAAVSLVRIFRSRGIAHESK